jgi:hypothetical protein
MSDQIMRRCKRIAAMGILLSLGSIVSKAAEWPSGRETID